MVVYFGPNLKTTVFDQIRIKAENYGTALRENLDRYNK